MARKPLTIAELRQRADAGLLTPEDLQQISWLRTARSIREVSSPAQRMTRDIAEFVRAYRENNYMTVEEFAQRCGLHRSRVSQIENGIAQTISLDTAIKLASGCGCTLQFKLERKRARLRKVA